MFRDVTDSGDDAALRAEFDNSLALRVHQKRYGGPPNSPRIVLSECQECGGEIEEARRNAPILGDITLCIECQRAREHNEALLTRENRHGWG